MALGWAGRLAEAARDEIGRETQGAVRPAVDITHQHVQVTMVTLFSQVQQFIKTLINNNNNNNKELE